MSDPIILITGATGNQGSATIDELLRRSKGRRIKALVRDPASDKAQALAARGIELARGDLDDVTSLRSALTGVSALLSVQTPMGHGPEGEERQGKQLATLAAEAGVGHIVQCSAAGVDRDTGVPHFESKLAIERHLVTVGLPTTILRPAAFMENLATLAFRTTMLTMMKTYLRRDQPMQFAAVRDVGWFAAEALDHPQSFAGETIEIAGDSLTELSVTATLRHSGHRPALSFTIPRPMRRKLPEDFRRMFEWIGREGFGVNIAALRRRHPGLLTLRDWASS